MELTKIVPLASGLRAACDLIDDDDPTPDPFSTYLHEHHLLDVLGLSIAGLEAIFPTIPRTPMGQAWLTAINISISKTAADGWRGFDEGRYNTVGEQDACVALDALADDLEAISVLLSPVADEIRWQDPMAQFSLGDIVGCRARITGHGVALNGRDSNMHDDDCDGTPRITEWAAWEHIEMLAPGTRLRLNKILGDLDAGFPDLAADDNGRTRLERLRND